MVVAMRSENEGILQLQASGRWAVCRPNRRPVEVTSGDVFRIQVDDMPGLQVTRMEFRYFRGPMKGCALRGLTGEYYSVHGYWLRNGLRAAIGAED
jgi:hypothetical protein